MDECTTAAATQHDLLPAGEVTMAFIAISNLPAHNALAAMWTKLEARLNRTTTMRAKLRDELLRAISVFRSRTLRCGIRLLIEPTVRIHIWVRTWRLWLRCNECLHSLCVIVGDAFATSASPLTVSRTFHQALIFRLAEEQRASCWITSVHACRAVVRVIGLETLQGCFHD